MDSPVMCPFCAFFCVSPQPVGNTSFGETAEIDGVLCCTGCYNTYQFSDMRDALLAFIEGKLVRIVTAPCAVWGLAFPSGGDPEGIEMHCENTAYWAYDRNAVCIECMQVMAGMNSDNAEAFSPALAAAKKGQQS